MNSLKPFMFLAKMPKAFMFLILEILEAEAFHVLIRPCSYNKKRVYNIILECVYIKTHSREFT